MSQKGSQNNQNPKEHLGSKAPVQEGGRIDGSATDVGARRAQNEALLAQFQAMPVLDERSADEIIGYDEHGLPSGTKRNGKK